MLSWNKPGPRDCACATPHEDLYSGDLTHYLETVKTAGECQVRAHLDYVTQPCDIGHMTI